MFFKTVGQRKNVLIRVKICLVYLYPQKPNAVFLSLDLSGFFSEIQQHSGKTSLKTELNCNETRLGIQKER